jgi:hypothetical protein
VLGWGVSIFVFIKDEHKNRVEMPRISQFFWIQKNKNQFFSHEVGNGSFIGIFDGYKKKISLLFFFGLEHVNLCLEVCYLFEGGLNLF